MQFIPLKKIASGNTTVTPRREVSGFSAALFSSCPATMDAVLRPSPQAASSSSPSSSLAYKFLLFLFLRGSTLRDCCRRFLGCRRGLFFCW